MEQEPRPITLAGVIAAYEVELRRFVLGRIGNQVEADDLLQELWYQLTRTLAQQPLTEVRAWLYRVARNLLIDRYRKPSPLWLEELLHPEEGSTMDQALWLASDDSPEAAYWQDQVWEALTVALDHLPLKQREVFVRNELEGTTLREIAEQQGEPLKTIISRKGYAVRRLREELRDFFEDLEDEVD
jgi:RNA polymerase sigma factor (sigma-70 family)